MPRSRSTRRTRQASAIAAAMAVALAACSGGSDDPTTPPTASATAPVLTTPTTPPPPSTTAAPSTPLTTPPTTAAPTAPPTTPTPPPATPISQPPAEITDPADPEIQAMVVAVRSHFDAFGLAMQQPGNAAVEQAALATTTGSMTGIVTETLARIRERGQASVPDPDEADRVEISNELAFVQGATGTVEACIVSPSKLVDVGTTVDASTFDDALESYAGTYTLQLIDGTWLVSNLQILDEFEGQSGCG